MGYQPGKVPTSFTTPSFGLAYIILLTKNEDGPLASFLARAPVTRQGMVGLMQDHSHQSLQWGVRIGKHCAHMKNLLETNLNYNDIYQ